MSTRSIILVKAHDSISRLYRHCDGYPTAQLPVISAALMANGKETRGLRFADCLVEVGAGMGARIAPEDFRAGSDLEITAADVGGQTDLEWIYVIDLINHNVSVYVGSWDLGENFRTVSRDMTSDPQGYADQLRAEYQVKERAAIVAAVLAFGPLGVTVNRPRAGTSEENNAHAAKMARRAALDKANEYIKAATSLFTLKQFNRVLEIDKERTYMSRVEAIAKVSKSERIGGLLLEAKAAFQKARPNLSIVKGA